MRRKSLTDRRAEKLAQLDASRRDLAALEVKAGERLGKLALKAGLGEVDVDDDTLLKQFEAVAVRFRPAANGARPKQAAARPPSPPAA
jgi:hypothetical protein